MFWELFWPFFAAGIAVFTCTEAFRFSIIVWQTRKHNKKAAEFENQMKAQLLANGIDPDRADFMNMFGASPGMFPQGMPMPVSGGNAMDPNQGNYTTGGYV